VTAFIALPPLNEPQRRKVWLWPLFSTLGITRVSPDHELKVSTIALTIDWIQIASLAA
jgi:hypothetical protein